MIDLRQPREKKKTVFVKESNVEESRYCKLKLHSNL